VHDPKKRIHHGDVLNCLNLLHQKGQNHLNRFYWGNCHYNRNGSSRRLKLSLKRNDGSSKTAVYPSGVKSPRQFLTAVKTWYFIAVLRITVVKYLLSM